MKRSIRWYLVRGAMTAAMSMLFFFLSAGPAIAWTQARNPWSETGSGTGWCSGQATNGNDPNYPCLYWQEPANTSVHLNFFVDPALSNVGGYDFTGAITWAFNQWNGAPAWNPYMVWNSGQTPNGYYWKGSSSDPNFNCALPAYTTFTTVGPLEYGYNPQRGGNEYYEFIKRTDVRFNPSIQWNFQGIFYPYCPGKADAYVVATHESGHVQGMGESGAYNAVMDAGPPYPDTLQQDDKNGIAAIYPGNQEHT